MLRAAASPLLSPLGAYPRLASTRMTAVSNNEAVNTRGRAVREDRELLQQNNEIPSRHGGYEISVPRKGNVRWLQIKRPTQGDRAADTALSLPVPLKVTTDQP